MLEGRLKPSPVHNPMVPLARASILQRPDYRKVDAHLRERAALVIRSPDVCQAAGQAPSSKSKVTVRPDIGSISQVNVNARLEDRREECPRGCA